MSVIAQILGTAPRSRTAREQDELREWCLERLLSARAKLPDVLDIQREQQRLLFGQLRGLWLAPHELLQAADAADHRMYIVLRGELRVFGEGSHVGTVRVGGGVGSLNEEEYYHTDSHYAGVDGCMLGVLDYAHSLAAHGRTMPVATQALQTKPSERSPQEVRVLHALLEDLAFFQQLSIEAEQLGCCRLLQMQQLKEGSVICQEGAVGDTFFIVLRGSVEVRVEGEEGRSEHLGVGGSFGKLSLLGQTEEDRRLRSTITAGAQCVCATLRRDEFLRVHMEVQQQLIAILAKPFLGRTRADTRLVADALLLAVAQIPGDRKPSKQLTQIAGHATLLSLDAGESVQLPGGCFLHVLEGQVMLDESPAVSGFLLSSDGSEGSQRFVGTEALCESESGGAASGPGSALECAQLMPIRAIRGVCKLLVVCSTDLRHVRRRAALQPWIDEAWGLCGGRSSDQINKLEWTDFWQGVLKILTPGGAFSPDSALACCVSDWHDMVKRAQWGSPQLRLGDDALQHEAFSEVLTSQIEEFWAITEPCPTLHAVFLAELLAATTRSQGDSSQNRTSQRLVASGMVKCHSEFFMELRNDARELMRRSLETPGHRSALERVEAELKGGSFTLSEAFELEKRAPIFDDNEQQAPATAAAALTPQADIMMRISHLASAASALPSQWSARLDAWMKGKVLPTADDDEDVESLMNITAGSVEWPTQSAENSDDDVGPPEPVNPVHPPPAKMKPVAIRGGPPPTNQTDVRMASPPREQPREGPSPPPPEVRLQGSPSAVPPTRVPVPPRTPPPVKRRTHKEIAKDLYAHRHTAIQRVASEDSINEDDLDLERRLPVVSQGLARSGNTQSWAPKSHKLPQDIHIGNAKGRMRPFQAPPDPTSIDPDTGLLKNRHRTTKPMDSPRNAEQRASARAERQKLRAAKAAATRTVVPGKLAPEPPRTVLQPKVIGSARETNMMTAEPEKIIRVKGVDTDPDRVYAVLPAGVPKEWIALHYKSEKQHKAQKKEAAAKCAAAIARGVKVASANMPIKAAANKKMPFVAAIGFSGMETALQGGGNTIAAAQTITAERWRIREESTFGCSRPPEVVPTATAYGHSGARKPLERLAPPTPLSPWCANGHTLNLSHGLLVLTPHGAVDNRNPTADLVVTPKAVVGGVDHKWHSKASLAATLVSPRMMSLSGVPNKHSPCTRRCSACSAIALAAKACLVD
eukprot:COSAG02_NODE_3635_length_6446_cov_1.452025_4_plen_1209_part_00